MPACAFGGVFDFEVLEQRPGIVISRASGKGADVIFKDESGGHRWQRTPPNEKRGRVHTSTITVAILPEPTEVQVKLDPRDLDFTTTRGSGPGGQARNKVETCVIVTHKPTGLAVRCETERSQHQNKASALGLLRARLWAIQNDHSTSARAADRKAQVGIGARGDKRRTIRVQDGVVNDHVTGKSWQYKNYEKGNWE